MNQYLKEELEEMLQKISKVTKIEQVEEYLNLLQDVEVLIKRVLEPSGEEKDNTEEAVAIELLGRTHLTDETEIRKAGKGEREYQVENIVTYPKTVNEIELKHVTENGGITEIEEVTVEIGEYQRENHETTSKEEEKEINKPEGKHYKDDLDGSNMMYKIKKFFNR